MPALHLNQDEDAARMLIQTVAGNYEGFTPREIKLARTAREAKAMMGNPSEETLKKAVSAGAIDNVPFDVAAVGNSRQIYGPALEDVRGKTPRKKPDRVEVKNVDIPRLVAERLKYLTMAADIFFVDKIPFLLTVTRGLHFLTAEYTPSRTAPKLAEHLKKVLRV